MPWLSSGQYPVVPGLQGAYSNVALSHASLYAGPTPALASPQATVVLSATPQGGEPAYRGGGLAGGGGALPGHAGGPAAGSGAGGASGGVGGGGGGLGGDAYGAQNAGGSNPGGPGRTSGDFLYLRAEGRAELRLWPSLTALFSGQAGSGGGPGNVMDPNRQTALRGFAMPMPSNSKGTPCTSCPCKNSGQISGPNTGGGANGPGAAPAGGGGVAAQ